MHEDWRRVANSVVMRRRRVAWWDNEGWRSELPDEEAVVASACQYLLVKGVAQAIPLFIAAQVAYREPTFADADIELSGRLPVEVFGPPRLYDLLTADKYGDDWEKRLMIERALTAPLPHSLDGARLDIDLEPRMQIVEPYVGWREEFGQQATGRGCPELRRLQRGQWSNRTSSYVITASGGCLKWTGAATRAARPRTPRRTGSTTRTASRLCVATPKSRCGATLKRSWLSSCATSRPWRRGFLATPGAQAPTASASQAVARRVAVAGAAASTPRCAPVSRQPRRGRTACPMSKHAGRNVLRTATEVTDVQNDRAADRLTCSRRG